MAIDLTISKDRVLKIYDLYAQKYQFFAKAMQEDCSTFDACDYVKETNDYWEQVQYIESQINEEIDLLADEGKELVAYKIRHALPLASVSPSRLLKVLEVCGVQYED